MTASHIRCLLAVQALSEGGSGVASSEVARLLGVRRPSVHNTLTALKLKGLIDKEHYGQVHLTCAGEALALRLERQREALKVLACALGLDADEGARLALLIMGGMSAASVEKLCAARELLPVAPDATAI